MNKQYLIDSIAIKSELTKQEAHKALDVFLDTVMKTLKSGEEISLTGFGAFSVIHRKERIGRNPKTGEELTIKASKSPSFKAGKLLRNSVK